MTQTPISLLLLKRLTLSSQLPKPPIFPLLSSLKPYHSTSTSTATASSSSLDPPKPTSLSSRMSFVFDQIDAIERDRVQKDQTLQRIRTWRHARNQEPTVLAGTENQNPDEKSTQDVKFEPRLNEERESESGLAETTISGEVRREKKEVELVHPWPEWIELMGRLLQQNYFDHRRKDENKFFENLGLDDVGNGDGVDEVDDFGIDFKDFRTVQTACLNLGKDRFDIMRSLSRQDIQLLVGYGCPSADKKVVFSAKLLRKHAHLDEGDICSSCSLRSSCERAYLLTNKEDEARTIDIMRILLAYGFDPINDSALNKTLLKKKSVKTVVRKLLHEVVKLSAVPIDPNLPPPVIKKATPKVKQPPPPPKRRVGRDDVEMKKGDWLCPKCDFMNFAKNSVCLQCDAKRPKRQLLPGEWECPECNFLNYRRNMVCFHCECKRPPDEFMENKMEGRQREHHTRPEKVSSRSEVSNAWNFDFDDNESDGADVAAFEYADSVRGEDSPLDSRVPGGNFRGPEGDLERGSRISRVHDGEYSDPDEGRYGRGFDDFDEEDDVDSYELDTQNSSPEWKASRNNFSDHGISGSKEVGGSDDELYTSHRRGPPSYSKPMRQKAALPGSEDDELDSDSDEELSVHPKWKSSHVADARNKPRGRGAKDSSKRMSFGSDEEADLDSDLDDDFGSTGKQRCSGRMNVRRNPDLEDVSFSGSDSDNDNQRNRGNKNFRGRGSRNFVREAKVGSKGKMGDSRDSWRDDFEGSFSSSHGKGRGFQGNGRGGRRMNDRGRNNSWSDDDEGSFARSHGKSRGFQGNERGGRRMNERGKNNSWSDDDDEGSFARSHGKSRGFQDNGRGGRRMNDRGRNNSWSDDDEGSFARSHGKSRGFQGNERGGRRMNERGKNNSWSDDDDEGSFARSHGKSRGFQDNGRGGRRMNDRSRNNSWSDDDGDSFPRSHSKGRGFRDNVRGGRRVNDRGGDIRSSRGTKRGGFEKRQGGRSDGYNNDRDWDDSEFRNSRRVIER